MRLIESGGLTSLTMRAVASELKVTPMAVYYYIKDKDELVGLVWQEVHQSSAPLRMQEDGWEASLRRHLITLWEVLARYPGLGAFLIDQPTLGVTPEGLRAGVRFFEQAGFSAVRARLAWSFALTYIHGRISVDARLAHNRQAPRLDGLRSHDYLEFGVEAVVAGLRALRDGSAEGAPVKGRTAEVPSLRSSVRPRPGSSIGSGGSA